MISEWKTTNIARNLHMHFLVIKVSTPSWDIQEMYSAHKQKRTKENIKEMWEAYDILQ